MKKGAEWFRGMKFPYLDCKRKKSGLKWNNLKRLTTLINIKTS